MMDNGQGKVAGPHNERDDGSIRAASRIEGRTGGRSELRSPQGFERWAAGSKVRRVRRRLLALRANLDEERRVQTFREVEHHDLPVVGRAAEPMRSRQRPLHSYRGQLAQMKSERT